MNMEIDKQQGGKRKIGGNTVTDGEEIDFRRQLKSEYIFKKNSIGSYKKSKTTKTTKKGGRLRSRRGDKKQNRTSKRRPSKTLSKH